LRVSDSARLYLVQFLSSEAVAATSIFMPNLAKNLGLTDLLLGFSGAAFGLAFLASSYFFARKTDVEGTKRYLDLGLILSALTTGLLYLTPDPWSLLAFYSLAGATMGMYPAALVSYVFGKKGRLGRFSAYGSLGSGLGWIIAGLVSQYLEIRTVFLLNAAVFVFSFLASFGMPKIRAERHNVPLFSPELFRKYWVVFVVFLIRHVGANIVWIVYPLYLAELGANLLTVSLLYAANPLGQFLFMYVITDRLSPRRLITLGLLFSFLAFFAMSLVTDIWYIVPVQVLVAASWSCLYVGALRDVTERDVRKATTTGLLNSVIYLGNSIGPLVGGAVSELSGGYRGNTLIATSVVFSALLLYAGNQWKAKSQVSVH